MLNSIYTANMDDQQHAWFYAEYEQARKEEVIGVLLALFLGGLGIHHFYLHRNGLGFLYLLLSWTGITTIIGFVECFFMPGRIRAYNAAQATMIAAQILVSSPHTASSGSAPHCTNCGLHVDPAAAFCINCGTAITSPSGLQVV